ncbi:MAG TPA: MBG domain-containing protein, partial [Pirellulales bacterium]|nr:MBG domain-containing protein [Pirellulales bacterium]
NLIGTTADGNFAVITNYVGQPNHPDGGSGVAIESGATLNLIGRPGAFGGNVISGNPTGGVVLRGAGATNTIDYNEIGLNADGTAALANAATQNFGIFISGTPSTIIGAASFSQGGNVISGNTGDGILLTDTPTVLTQISGNFIGTDNADRNPFGNGGFGIDITGLSPTLGHASGSMVTNNVVSGNLRGGIAVSNGASGNTFASNFIGTDTQGGFLLPNSGVAIEINNAPNNIIGGPKSTVGNQITNTQPNPNPSPTAIPFEASGTGILIAGSGSIGNHVENNTVVANAGTGVLINAAAAGNYIGGAGQGNTIINNRGSGIAIASAADNVVQGNLIGVQKIGGGVGEPAGNDKNGILLNAAVGNLIGADSPDPTRTLANVISANKAFAGVILASGSNGNTVAGNLIGTNLQGAAQQGFGNVAGIQIADSSNNVIGGETQSAGAAPGNEILGNGGGVDIFFADSQGNKVLGNNISGSIGFTNTSGTFVPGAGVSIENGSSQNFIGGSNAADGNTISNNGGNGVEVTSGSGNAIGSNLIFGNGQLGISLQPVNGSAGGNNLQKAPFVQLATSYDSHRIAGFVQGTPNTTYYLQFFSGTTFQHADGSENDDAEGIVYVDTDLPLASVKTSNGGYANFDFDFRDTFSADVAAGMIIRATATDANGNTSQFSNAVTVEKDSNGDGVPDVDELKAGNGKSKNANSVSFPDIFNSLGFFTLSVAPGTQFTRVWSTQDPDPKDPNGGPPSEDQFGEGFVSFQLTGVQPGAAVVVTMNLPTSGTDPNSYWRYGKTPDNQADHWYNWIWDGNPNHTGAEINGHTIKLHLIDGALGDDDLSANGIIVDPGAPGFPDPYTVTTTADSGPGSLRQAILNANANPRSKITFDLPGTGPQTIQPLSPLPAITADVTIDGSTEPGFAGTPVIVLDGSQAGAGADGLKVTSGFAKIQDLVINQFSGDGIHVLDAGSAQISGNYIGTDASGKTADGNGLYGIEIEDDDNDADNDGDDDNPAGRGDSDDDAGSFNQQCTIDGGNVISGNLTGGIYIHGWNARFNTVTSNLIGTQADGVSPLGNGGPGILIDGGHRDTIGGQSSSNANTIAYNAGPGVEILKSTFNQIEANSIFANQGLGIDLNSADNANDSQPAPVLASAVSYNATTFVSGTLNASPDSSYTIDFYATDQADQSGGAQGQIWLGSISVTTDNNGQASFDAELAASAASGTFITATSSYFGETSVFSAPFALTPNNPLVLIVNTGSDVPDADCGLFTLRQAILASNAHPGQNIIQFDLPNSDRVIQPLSALPAITDAVIIDGTSQPGYQGLPLVELDGSQAGTGAVGLDITGGGSIVRGLAVHSFSSWGIELTGLGANVIEGNFLGTDVTGTKAMTDDAQQVDLGDGAPGGDVFINGSPDNLIGGTTAAARNLILAVQVTGPGATGNHIEGNYIGTDLTGKALLSIPQQAFNGALLGSPLPVGIEIDSRSNTVGGLEAGAGNVIERGVLIGRVTNPPPDGHGNVIQGNLIGTDVTGTVFLSVIAGTFGSGVELYYSNDDVIGGTTAAARNIIPGGVEMRGTTTGNLVQGNYLGTDISGTVALGGGGVSLASTSDTQVPTLNTIGGAEPGAGNLIGGGISLSGNNNTIQGNRIGTDVTGTKALGKSGFGIDDIGYNNTIGGSPPGEGNLISGKGGDGIILRGSQGGDTVQGNLIGTDVTGTKAIGNGGDGIDVDESGAIIGGSQPGDGNVISGNVGNGIFLESPNFHLTGLVIQGNYIGTDVTGTMPLGNGGDGISNGVSDVNSPMPNSVIGGASPGAGNVIAANGGDGIRISDPSIFALGGDISSGIVIQGNMIGTDVTGTHNLGNAGDGLSIITSNLLASNETIGGTSPGLGNTIAFNGGRGVDIPFGNGNTVRGNDIFDNGGLGLITDSNAAAATYAENRGIQLAQAPPVLTSAVFGPQGTVVTGSLTGTPLTSYEIDFFANNGVNPTGFGEGQTYLQSISVVADGTGSAQFQIPLGEAVPVGQWITATATPDTTGGNTSMFSLPAPVVAAAGNTVQFSSPNYLVTETGGKTVIVVTRSGDTSGTTTVAYATTGGSATAGVNYTAESGTLTFAAGITSQTITIPVQNDGQADSNKDFQIVLSNPGGSSLGAVSTADVTIADSDTAGQIEFSSPTCSVDLAVALEAERIGAAPPSVFTITRTGGSQGAVSVEYRVTGGTAVSAGYVEDSFGTVTFAPGQTTAQIQLGYGESAYQGPQTLQVTIGNPTGGAVLGAITTSVLTIDDAEDQNGAFQIQSQLQVYESGDQITAASAPQAFKLSSDAMFKVTVGATSTTVDLPASTTASNASVNDLVGELDTALQAAGLGGNPTVTTALVYNVYANASGTGALVLITNAPASLGAFSISDAGPGTSNDGYAELGFTNPQGAAGQAVIEVDRLGQSSTTEEVSYNTVDGTAKAGTNYVATSGTLTFQPGQTQADIDVPIIDDHLNDNPGTFQVVLSDPTGGAFIVDGLGQSTVTILDRDASAPPPPATLVVETVNNQGSFGGFPENSGTAKITVKRVDAITGVADGDGASGEVQVDYSTSDGTAHVGSDYTAESGTLTFGPGQAFASFSVPLIPGQDVPDTRTFLVTLSNVVGNAVISADNPVTETIVGTPGQIDITSPTYTVAESSAALSVTVTNLPGTNRAFANTTVDYVTHDGTAIAGTEYTAVSGTLTFTAGVTSQTITIPILNDQLLENTPTTFSLTLSNPTGGPTIGNTSTTEITILEDGDAQLSTVPSTTTVKSDKASGSIYGQAVTFTATVSAATGAPSGAVDFVDTTTGQDLGTVPLALVDCDGEASLTVSSLAVGSHTIVANYTGDTGTYAVSHGSLTQLVTPAKLTVKGDNRMMVFGATVPALTDTITGFVNGDTASAVSGAASLSTTATSTSGVGSYPIAPGQGTLSAANYTFSFVNGTLAIVPAKLTLTVAAANQTMVYGATVPALTDTITGFVDGDSATVVSGTPSITTTATSASGVGSYPIDVSAGTLSASNYTFAFVAGTLTVRPATLTVTASSTTMVYGSTVPAVTDTITGFVNGDTSSVVTGTASLGTIATSASGVGTYAYTVGLGTLSAANYTFAFVGGTLAVTPVMLTVTADNQTQVYGSADPPLTATITGFVKGDTSNVVSGAASLSTTATSASGVGSYAITAGLGTLSAANYTFAFASGTLTVTPATLTVMADDQTMVYGAAVPPLTATIRGFVNGDTSSVVSGTPSLSTAATTASGVGSYAITAAGTLSAANYTFVFVNGTLSVTPATLTVTPDDQTMVYGATVPTLAATITGLVNGDTSSVVSGAASLGTAAISASGVGSYLITAVPGTLSAANYTFAFADGTLTVTPATLTVTADNKTMVFGAAVPTLTATITGFVNGDDTASVVSLSTTATSASGVGSYAITVGAGTLIAPNYTFTFVNGTLSVVAATLTLTVTADDQTMVYGSTVPTLTATITGFVNGDTSSVVGGAASLSTTATSASGVGSYPIDVSLGTLGAANYTFAFVDGTLTVTPASLTVLANDQTMVYGATVPALTATIFGFVNGDTSSVVSG